MMISETNRLSIRYHTNTHDEREHNSWMFMDDFSQNIVPVYGSKHEIVQCTLEPVNADFQERLSELLPSYKHRYNEDFNDIILGTIQFIAQHLVHHGYLVLEFVTQKDINEDVIYKLETVFGKEVKIKGDNVIQVIHADAAEHLKITAPVVIPIAKCFVIDFPKSLGGKEKYLKFLEEFKELGQQSPMMSYFRNPLTGYAGYDMTEHQRLHDLELWRKSKVYNWHHRESSGKLFSGYYHIYRHLQFRKSKIELRNYVVEQLKEIISKLSEKFGDKTELKIEGLISSERIDETLEQWKSGELKPNSISEVL
ncbi:hypothetical protein [Nonlabens xiamenensis]|uniref:hypothetical protein n=1 Tax=Nonlabens xiamenensis TaxID=2341043 RepID=UPI000F6059B4|nr:hypothetical protein [Nonlabens xiamenensis]